MGINKEHDWESAMVCNPGVALFNNKVYMLYRAGGTARKMKSAPRWPVSQLGLAILEDGVTIHYRSPEPVMKPEEENWVEADGVEDPRITKIGDTYYIVYVVTGFTWDRIALATTKDFKVFQRHGIIMKDVAQRTSALFPEKYHDKYLLVHRIIPSVWFSQTKDFQKFTHSKIVLTPDVLPWCEKKIGVAFPPLKIGDTWVMFFHGVDRNGCYRVGVCWLDGKNPYKVIKMQRDPVLEPEAEYEKTGFTASVVYPCGAVEMQGTLFIYYGAGDQHIALASVEKKALEI